MIPLYLGEIWAVDTFFLLPCKLKRLHSQRGVQYWGCSGPSDPAGFFFSGELGRVLSSAAQHWIWGVCGVFAHFCHAARTAQAAPWQAPKRACRNVCVFVPESALWWRVVYQPGTRAGNVRGETKTELPGSPGFRRICSEDLKQLLILQVGASSIVTLSFCAILLRFGICKSLGTEL